MPNSWVASKVRNKAGIVAVQSEAIANSREPRAIIGVANKNFPDAVSVGEPASWRGDNGACDSSNAVYQLNYTIIAGESLQIPVILEALDHKKHNQRFGYRSDSAVRV